MSSDHYLKYDEIQDINYQTSSNNSEIGVDISETVPSQSSEYNSATSDIKYTAEDIIHRLSDQNPFLGRGVGISNTGSNPSLPVRGLGYGGYVTKQGFFKPYSTTGIGGYNDCPVATTPLTNQNNNNYKYAKSLKNGTPMTVGQTCGNEGTNVYTSQIISNPSTKYIGCYNNKDADIDAINPGESPSLMDHPTNVGYLSFNECQNYAIDNNFQYFGLQDYNKNNDQKSMCVVKNTNDVETLKKYGDATQNRIVTQIWQSKTSNTEGSGGYILTLRQTGQIMITKDNNNIYKYPDNPVNGCINSGKINIVSAVFGANVSGFMNMLGSSPEPLIEGFSIGKKFKSAIQTIIKKPEEKVVPLGTPASYDSAATESVSNALMYLRNVSTYVTNADKIYSDVKTNNIITTNIVEIDNLIKGLKLIQTDTNTAYVNSTRLLNETKKNSNIISKKTYSEMVKEQAIIAFNNEKKASPIYVNILQKILDIIIAKSKLSVENAKRYNDKIQSIKSYKFANVLAESVYTTSLTNKNDAFSSLKKIMDYDIEFKNNVSLASKYQYCQNALKESFTTFKLENNNRTILLNLLTALANKTDEYVRVVNTTTNVANTSFYNTLKNNISNFSSASKTAAANSQTSLTDDNINRTIHNAQNAYLNHMSVINAPKRPPVRVVPPKDVSSILKPLVDNKKGYAVTPTNDLFVTPNLPSTSKLAATYKCGNRLQPAINVLSGNSRNMDCSEYIKQNCTFYLFLNENNCKLELYRFEPSKDKDSLIWSLGDKTTALIENKKWVSSTSPYKIHDKSTLSHGETLTTNQWFCSVNGKLRLIMLANGNLELQTSVIQSGCDKSNTYGLKDVNAIYEINDYNSDNINNINKLAYVDSDSKLRIYPDSMIEKSNKYISYLKYDSKNPSINNINNVNNVNDCEIACNSNADCSGYVYDTIAKSCSLKGGPDIFLKKEFNSMSNTILGLRKPQVKSDMIKTCNKNIVDIDTLKFNKYAKGEDMNTDIDCDALKELDPLYSKVNLIDENMQETSYNATYKMNDMIRQSNKDNQTMKENKKRQNRDIKQYNNNKRDLSNSDYSSIFGFQNLYSEYNYIEGMQNLTQDLMINDVNGMLSDSDTRILQANYSYILWSVLAVGLLSITVNTINK
jgi:hypothetical protein